MVLNHLNKCIDELCSNPQKHLVNPEKDFTRNRKIGIKTVIRTLFAMQNKSLSHELLELFKFNSNVPTASAFVQQRSKIKPSAFEHIFKEFTNSADMNFKTYRGYRLFAVDGSQIVSSSYPEDSDSFFRNNSKSYNILHLNVMYDLLNHIYTDVVIQKQRKENEYKAFADMIDHSNNISKAIVIADRGYESYNDMAHVQEKGWNFLIRLRDSKCGCMLSGFDFPEGEFDTELSLNITRNRTDLVNKSDLQFKSLTSQYIFDYLPLKAKKQNIDFYTLKVRFVRFKLTDNSYEVVATNLDKNDFSPFELKKLYAMRWGIETSFRSLKYTVGLLSFHSKKVDHIFQEIFSRLTMYNFSELITSHVVIQQKNRKYCYKANFSQAVQVCRNFFLEKISPPNVETLIAHSLTPIRPGRQCTRILNSKGAVSFVYRIA